MALKPATAPSPSDPCVHRLRLFCDVWQAPAVDFFLVPSTTCDGLNGDFVPCSRGLLADFQPERLLLIASDFSVWRASVRWPLHLDLQKKMLRSHDCVVEFRRVCEFECVFLPYINPSQGSRVCGCFFCSTKITMHGPSGAFPFALRPCCPVSSGGRFGAHETVSPKGGCDICGFVLSVINHSRL